jgi:hypothetical protein
MNNTERLYLYTLPRWAGVAVQSISEQLSDMWIRGENAGHHSGIPYDPDAIQLLIDELKKDFKGAPSTGTFSANIKTVHDLDDEMQNYEQKPLPKPPAMLAALLSAEDMKVVSARPRRKVAATKGASRDKKKKKGRKSR